MQLFSGFTGAHSTSVVGHTHRKSPTGIPQAPLISIIVRQRLQLHYRNLYHIGCTQEHRECHRWRRYLAQVHLSSPTSQRPVRYQLLVIFIATITTPVKRTITAMAMKHLEDLRAQHSIPVALKAVRKPTRTVITRKMRFKFKTHFYVKKTKLCDFISSMDLIYNQN